MGSRRQATFKDDMEGLREAMKTARSPPGLLTVKLGEIDRGEYVPRLGAEYIRLKERETKEKEREAERKKREEDKANGKEDDNAVGKAEDDESGKNDGVNCDKS